jgi:NAD(P)-dependent dehydrogenase (short-subunit alcohol dehydrogenase family)
VIAVDTDEQRLENMSSEFSGSTGRVLTYCIDATDEKAVKRTLLQISENNKKVDILINAVGGSTIIDNPKARVDELVLADWQKIINFNLNSMFIFTTLIVPLMKSQGGGKIVNLASIAGRGFSDVSSSAYAAAKGGVIAFTKKTAGTGTVWHYCQCHSSQYNSKRENSPPLGATKFPRPSRTD